MTTAHAAGRTTIARDPDHRMTTGDDARAAGRTMTVHAPARRMTTVRAADRTMTVRVPAHRMTTARAADRTMTVRVPAHRTTIGAGAGGKIDQRLLVSQSREAAIVATMAIAASSFRVKVKPLWRYNQHSSFGVEPGVVLL